MIDGREVTASVPIRTPICTAIKTALNDTANIAGNDLCVCAREF